MENKMIYFYKLVDCLSDGTRIVRKIMHTSTPLKITTLDEYWVNITKAEYTEYKYIFESIAIQNNCSVYDVEWIKDDLYYVQFVNADGITEAFGLRKSDSDDAIIKADVENIISGGNSESIDVVQDHLNSLKMELIDRETYYNFELMTLQEDSEIMS